MDSPWRDRRATGPRLSQALVGIAILCVFGGIGLCLTRKAKPLQTADEFEATRASGPGTQLQAIPFAAPVAQTEVLEATIVQAKEVELVDGESAI